MKNFTRSLLRTPYVIALLATLCIHTSYGQVVDIINNPANSANVVFATNLYAANESIYTETEIGVGNFITPASAINSIAFNIAVIGANPSFTNITIWMKEVPAATTSFASGTYTTTGYTQVFSGTVSGAALGWVRIPLTTAFQRTNGNNLQVLIERKDGQAHIGYSYRSAGGNNVSTATLSSRRYNDATPLSATTSLTASTFRPQLRLQHIYANDAMVQEIYSLGKLPIPFSTPHTIKANIINTGGNALTNVPVTLNITGANIFTNTQTIPSLAAGAGADVTFSVFTPVTQGNDNISVSIPNDDFNGNNVKSVVQKVNNNTFSYSYGNIPIGAAGITGGNTGDFAARYNTSVATAISQVSVNFIAGGRPFRIAIWDATGAGGTPGNMIFSSTTLTSTAGVYVLPILPAVPIPVGDFFVGIQQTSILNVSFAYQNEDPIRINTFFQTNPTNGTVWTDLAPLFKFRFMVEPKLQIPIDANVSNIITPAATCNTGAVNYGVVLSNVGLNTINVGAANITLKIRGANSYTGTLSNATNIVAGTSETISFNGININNPGINSDTAYVVLAGDTEPENDTLKTVNTSVIPTPITSFPAVEDAEGALPLLPNFQVVSGAVQLWRVQTGNYTNASQVTALSPHGGTNFFLFDSYGGGNSTGYISRLSSNCITLPVNAGVNCGYKLRCWMSHDNTIAVPQADSLYISVSTNNGVTWTRLLPGFQRPNAGYATPGWEKLEKDLSAYAGQTIQIGFEGVSKSGNAFGLDDISIASIPAQELTLSTATNNGIALTKQCDDQGWTYYSNPAVPAAGLFAINWDPSGTGTNAAAKAAVTVSLTVDPSFYSVVDIPAKKATYTMKRFWNLNPNSTALTGPVNIRFFYDAVEKTALDNAASAFASANTGTLETATWFLTNSGTNFVANAAHVNAEGVLNASALTNVNVSNNTINSVAYAQFNGVQSLTAGTYATGVGPLSPLPVTLLNFDVKRSGKINEITWSTSLEQNTKRFLIERGADGRNFSSIGEVKASATGNTVHNYSFSDNFPLHGINYYRLRVVDIDNSGKYSATRSVRNLGSVDIAIYPNPVKAVLHVKINADKADKGEMQITDISGKIILAKTLTVTPGTNLVPVTINKMAAGSYVLKITFSDDVVIRKFDKQ